MQSAECNCAMNLILRNRKGLNWMQAYLLKVSVPACMCYENLFALCFLTYAAEGRILNFRFFVDFHLSTIRLQAIGHLMVPYLEWSHLGLATTTSNFAFTRERSSSSNSGKRSIDHSKKFGPVSLGRHLTRNSARQVKWYRASLAHMKKRRGATSMKQNSLRSCLITALRLEYCGIVSAFFFKGLFITYCVINFLRSALIIASTFERGRTCPIAACQSTIALESYPPTKLDFASVYQGI